MKEQLDKDYIRQVVELLGHREAGGVTEVRIFPQDRYVTIKGRREFVGATVSGYYDDYQKLVDDIAPFDGKTNIYVTINPVISDLLARANNRLQYNAKTTTSDNDILCDLWFGYDCDPNRPAEISATEAELQAALKRRDELSEFLSQWAQSLLGMSGNGGHGLIRLPGYPNNAETRQAKERLTKFLHDCFTDWEMDALGNPILNEKGEKVKSKDGVNVDNTVYNMARIWKLYGTMAVKGDDFPDRPHRRSFLEIPKTIPEPVDLYAHLSEIIPQERGQAQEPPKAQKPSSNSRKKETSREGDYPLLDVPAYLNASGVTWRTKEKSDKTWYQFETCPIHPDDDGDRWECGICQDVNGKMGAKCMHDPNFSWQDFKEVLGDPKPYYVNAIAKGKKANKPVSDSPKKFFRKGTFIPKWLAEEITKDNHFVYAGEQFYRYEGGVYRPGAEDFVSSLAQELLGMESRQHRISEVLFYIQNQAKRPPDELNPRSDLINLSNRMLDWINEKLLPHSPDYLSTIRIPVKYDPQATCPEIDRFFKTTLPADCIDLIEEFFGYCLIPDTRFEKAFMLVGSGANGKSTLLKLLSAFLGFDNISRIALQEIDDNRFARAGLYGKLANVCADLDSRALKSSSFFKAIVSGDTISGERKFRDSFNFTPFTRLIFSANEIPSSKDRTYAFYRRWCIIPFPNRFEGDKEDKSLIHKLTKPDELSGLLNRALQGLTRLFANENYTESDSVKQELQRYKTQNDSVLAFVSEECVIGEDYIIPKKQLYDEYVEYCKGSNYIPVSQRRFNERLLAEYPQLREDRNLGMRTWKGIGKTG